MKIRNALLLLFLCGSTLALAQTDDPTQPSARMRSAMMAKGSSFPALNVKGLVMGVGKRGVVLLEAPGTASAPRPEMPSSIVAVVARPETAFNIVVEGQSYHLVVKGITPEGIQLENVDTREAVSLPTYGSVEPGMVAPLGANISYLEFREAPLMDALRMIADQSGNNYSASMKANKAPVSAFLRHVPADVAIEEVCKSHNLWFKKDEATGITRIMAVDELEKDLVGFREEQTEVFTLLYPNVTDVAISIRDLFGDRVVLSLGNEDSDSDARDLESRFDRFNIIGRGNVTASVYQNSSTTYTGAGGVNVINNGGNNGFGGNDGASVFRGNSYRQELDANYRQRYQRDPEETAEDYRRDVTNRFNNLTASQVQRLERALSDPTQDAVSQRTIDALRSGAPTIYVTASKRNNMIVVRTSDNKALEDIRSLIRRMDVPTPLVLLEVKVLRVELGDGFQSAFEYAVTDGQVGGTFSTGEINPSVIYDPITGLPSQVVATPGIGSTGLREGQFIFQYLGDTLRARLQLLESKKRINTIASPTLLTAHNEVSRLFLGEERPMVRNIGSQTILTDNNAATTPNTQIEFRAVGTTLLITPNINSDRTVTLRLLQENSSINPDAATIPVVTTSSNDDSDNDTESDVREVPVDVVTSRSVSGTFVAKDGMPVVIGGLIEDADNDDRAQVPLLGRIPVLGVLFRRQDKNKGKSEMLVMVRPHIMSTPSDGQKISESVLFDLSQPARDRLVHAGFLLPPPPPPALDPAPAAPAAQPPAEPIKNPKRKFFWQKY